MTGGICSGKTTLSSYLAKKHNLVYRNADTLARNLQRRGTKEHGRILEAFGNGVCYRDGRLNRKKLAQIVFSHPAARDRLNRILHPEVIRILRAQLATAQRRRVPAVIVEIPLLFEAHLEKLFDTTVAVSAKRQVQVKRVRRCFGLTRQEALERIAAQMSSKEKEKKADFVIRNSDTGKILLERKADRLWEKISTKNR